MKYKCLICGNTNFSELLHYNSLPIVLGPVSKSNLGKIDEYPLTMCFCDYCYHVQQIDPIPQEISNTIYTDDYYPLTSTVMTGMDLSTINNFYEFFNACEIKDGNILEIGCYDGNLLLKLYDDGLNIFGIDPSNLTGELKKKVGEERIINDFFTEKTYQNKKFDVVIFRNLLEHLYDINVFIKNVKNILKTNGHIFIDVPNFKKGVESGGFGDYIHEHLSSFSIETITYFLDLHRFEIKKFVEEDYLFICAKNINEGYIKPYKPKYSFDKNGLKHKSIKHYNKVKNDFLYFFESNDYKSIGIFGVSSQTNALARVLNNQQRRKISGLFDNDKYKHGKYISGIDIPVESPDRIKDSKLDIILISTYLFEKDILTQLKSFQLEGLKTVTFYPDVNVHEL